MKKIILATFIASFFYACNDSTSTESETEQSSSSTSLNSSSSQHLSSTLQNSSSSTSELACEPTEEATTFATIKSTVSPFVENCSESIPADTNTVKECGDALWAADSIGTDYMLKAVDLECTPSQAVIDTLMLISAMKAMTCEDIESQYTTDSTSATSARQALCAINFQSTACQEAIGYEVSVNIRYQSGVRYFHCASNSYLPQ